MRTFFFTRKDLPGVLSITTGEDSRGNSQLEGLSFCGSDKEVSGEEAVSPFEQEVVSQLNAYFEGMLTDFKLPLGTKGTPFQESCWEALKRIPYGKTVSYGEQARAVGNPKACRAVGGANHRNPIAIVIPCHRVIGASGKLTGFGGGLSWKTFLLELEKRTRNKSMAKLL
jgi:methylated-DNA-[protein]-cysteine S-methyltransferase